MALPSFGLQVSKLPYGQAHRLENIKKIDESLRDVSSILLDVDPKVGLLSVVSIAQGLCPGSETDGMNELVTKIKSEMPQPRSRGERVSLREHMPKIVMMELTKDKIISTDEMTKIKKVEGMWNVTTEVLAENVAAICNRMMKKLITKLQTTVDRVAKKWRKKLSSCSWRGPAECIDQLAEWKIFKRPYHTSYKLTRVAECQYFPGYTGSSEQSKVESSEGTETVQKCQYRAESAMAEFQSLRCEDICLPANEV